jgi:hypothetical protein
MLRLIPGLVLLLGLTALLGAPATAHPPGIGNGSPLAGNLVVNGDFETGHLSPWTVPYPAGAPGAGVIVTSPVHTGTHALQVITNAQAGVGSGVAGGGNCDPVGLRIPVQPNATYSWWAWIFVPQGTQLDSAYMRVAWYPAANCDGGAQIDSQRSHPVTTASGTWIQSSGTSVAPPDAGYAEIRLGAVPASNASITIYFDDVTLVQIPNTPTPTNTPLPTPTPHAGHFEDVPPANPFYSYIECIGSRNLISGYTCGTTPDEPCVGPENKPYFRPANNLTRGQAAKIVALAAGYSGQPITQTFEDVPPEQPFYPWIEAAAQHGIISGYTCGGPGEPCVPPGNRPYFRPSANVTRGQLSKIVANAANFSDAIPPTQQTFSDIPSSQPFWLYIERVARHGVISGYTCGQPPAGPCDGQHRPYFLPGNNVTRGQTAKVVANAFFPNCTPLPPSPTPTRVRATPTTTPVSGK